MGVYWGQKDILGLVMSHFVKYFIFIVFLIEVFILKHFQIVQCKLLNIFILYLYQ